MILPILVAMLMAAEPAPQTVVRDPFEIHTPEEVGRLWHTFHPDGRSAGWAAGVPAAWKPELRRYFVH